MPGAILAGGHFLYRKDRRVCCRKNLLFHSLSPYNRGMRIQVRRPTEAELDGMGVATWPIWTCGVSRFDWSYDAPETCYLLEGEVTVEAGGERVSFGKGDLVQFPQGLSCVWEVTVPVRKHYRFG
jgi:hypothetical protein